MTKNNIIYDEEDLKFIRDMKECFNSCCEFIFLYKDKWYRIEPADGKLLAYLEETGSREYLFDDLDDLIEHYIVEGLPFKDIIPEINEYDIE